MPSTGVMWPRPHPPTLVTTMSGWASNSSNQLTTGGGSSLVPVTRTGLTGTIQQICVCQATVFALLTDGTLWAWGANGLYACGINPFSATSPINTPTQIMSGVASVAGGQVTGYAIKTDGTVWAWGDNVSSGQYGRGDQAAGATQVPIQIANLAGMVAISAVANCVGLKADGTLWSWGHQNGTGGVGNGTLTGIVTTPVQILTGVAEAKVGTGWGLARKTDNTLWAWGDNTYGQLGTNNHTQTSVPIQVLTGVKKLANELNSNWSMVIKTDDTLWTWGRGAFGNLGNNGTAESMVPVQILTGVAMATGGTGLNGLALKLDGTLWGWGNNGSGAFGNNTSSNSLVPIQLPQTGVTSIHAGTGGSVHAISASGTPNPTTGQLWPRR